MLGSWVDGQGSSSGEATPNPGRLGSLGAQHHTLPSTCSPCQRGQWCSLLSPVKQSGLSSLCCRVSRGVSRSQQGSGDWDWCEPWQGPCPRSSQLSPNWWLWTSAHPPCTAHLSSPSPLSSLDWLWLFPALLFWVISHGNDLSASSAPMPFPEPKTSRSPFDAHSWEQFGWILSPSLPL